ncbi:MAG: FtsW/RodA/SpoVE family cell cycle protein, partial [Candidatus Hydrogenedentota bacterium]
MSLSVPNDMSRANIRLFNLGNFARMDWVLSLLVLMLAAIGILVLYSSNRSASTVTGAAPYYLRQLMFIPVGVLLALMIMCIDYRVLVSLGPLFYVALVALLVLVMFFGDTAKGATRWLVVGPIRFQPSEQSKLALIFMLTWYFTTIGNRIQKLPYFLLTFLIAAVPGILILKQPSLGTATTLGPITFAMLYIAGCKRWHLAAIVGAGAVTIPIAWSKVLTPYQRTRVSTIFDPGSDPLGDGYQTIQSMISVGSGGASGKGFMESTQTYLSYMPEHHTDFIFSLLAEEWGFLGSTFVVVLFLLLFYRGLGVAQSSQDLAGALPAVG